MSTRLQMLQVARLAPTLLGEAADLVASFIESTHQPDGGYADRAGRSDLYYTVFAIEGLIALQRDPPADALRRFLKRFGDGAGHDLVHLACLARCWAAIRHDGFDDEARRRLIARVATYRAADGGFHQSTNQEKGSSYAAFVAFGAYQDLDEPLPDAERLVESLQSLADPDVGGYWLDASTAAPTTPTTAAAVTVLRQLGATVDARAGDYLLSQFRLATHDETGEGGGGAVGGGGFVAAPLTPIPDLLSTAVALHALAALHVDCPHIKEPCLDFIDSLWTSRGGFYGSWQDDVVDTEYTYYGLLALGHLSVM